MTLNKIRYYLKLEAVSGMVLFFAALAALVISNTPLFGAYERLFTTPLTFSINGFAFAKPLHFWVNDCLMTVFFLLIGLELKREFIEGALSERSKIILPGMGALGGMILPALIYIAFNRHHPIYLQGWPIPVATDIAFALGVLSLLGKRVPLGLKLFLMTLAIFDDIGAILIIAAFYTHALAYFYLFLAGFVLLLLINLKRLSETYLLFYWVLGFLLWVFILKSGIHATVAGVLFAFTIPIQKKQNERQSPLHLLEEALHPWVAYLVLPLFAFANAGLSFHDLTRAALFSPLIMGIVAGLFLGKQVGVFLFVWLTKRMGFATLPDKTSWFELYGVALLCGIGFTMSLFLGTLAFENIQPIYLMDVRLGVFVGSLLSGLSGVLVLQMAFRNKRKGGSSVERKK